MVEYTILNFREVVGFCHSMGREEEIVVVLMLHKCYSVKNIRINIFIHDKLV